MNALDNQDVEAAMVDIVSLVNKGIRSPKALRKETEQKYDIKVIVETFQRLLENGYFILDQDNKFCLSTIDHAT